jgi:hypothetical protein
MAMHRFLEENGRFIAKDYRFLIEARKPVKNTLL